MRGRKPDPAAVRRGTAHVRKSMQLLPAGYGGALTVGGCAEIPLPREMPRTKAAKTLWQTMLAAVARSELRPEDLPLVEACCLAKYRHAEAGAFVKKWGLMVKGGPDGIKRNPMLEEERQQALLYDRLAQRLGLSPEARIRLNLIQIAGTTMLGSLRRRLDEVVEAELDDVIESEASDVE
ncbi:MAG: P27 family phage terminase small subunit [Thermoleophilia bacterium]